jgi:hypothetical protein
MIRHAIRSQLRPVGVAGLLQAFRQCDRAWIAVDAGLANVVRPSGHVNGQPFRFMYIDRLRCIVVTRYFFISIINMAMSWASLRLSGRFGIVACGRSRNEAIMSALIVSLAAISANDGTP